MRWGILLAIVLALGTHEVRAIEMFTNFHNGENVGFPPLQVPTSVYGGFGHGGWNPHATGMRMPADPFPAVPAMTPTGQYPACRWLDYYGAAPGQAIGQTTGQDGNSEPVQLVSDRRHGRWQRGGSNFDNESNQSNGAASSRRTDNAGPSGDNESKVAGPTPAAVVEIKTPDAEFISQLQSIEVSKSTNSSTKATP